MKHEQTNKTQKLKMEFEFYQFSTRIEALERELHNTQNYNNFLEARICEMEIKLASTVNKLKQLISILHKAQDAIKLRRNEVQTLQVQNDNLALALKQKNALLQEEMLQHEQTQYKLATAQHKLAQTQAEIRDQASKAPIQIIEAAKEVREEEALADYYSYLILEAAKDFKKTLPESEFFNQLRYLEQKSNEC